MEANEIKEVYAEVFPKSLASVSPGCLGGGLYLKGYLLNKGEFPNGISHNDPLSYMAVFEDGEYSESNLSLFCKPTEKYMAYSSKRLRKKTIKNITREKLLARFEEIKAFVKENAADCCLDISGKVGD